MSTAGKSGRSELRLNDVDWQILEVMSDGRRVTQKYLYDDVEELEEHSSDWVRQRVSRLAESGMIERVQTSQMWTISDWGMAALELREEYEESASPREFSELVRDHAAQSSNGDE